MARLEKPQRVPARQTWVYFRKNTCTYDELRTADSLICIYGLRLYLQ